MNKAFLEIARRRAGHKLARYRPYPKQYEFHKAGATYRERLFKAGNQLGKTHSASYEVCCHATGDYPDWWVGKRFDKPVLIWTGSETNESSKEIIQTALLGTENPDMNDDNFGTGSIPKELIKKVTTRQAGVKGVADEILVKHKRGTSRIALKTYEQGKTKWQGKPVDVVWFDEEPDFDIYSEGVTRTNKTNGIVFTTFTPLRGYTKTVKRFLSPEEGSPPRHVTNMTIYDCIGGHMENSIWPDGEWTGHYTKERVDDIVAAYPEHERETRAKGIPMAGEGLVFPIDEKAIKCDPFEIPRYWLRGAAIDFGLDHPTAGVQGAYDEGNDILYITDCYRKSGESPVYHAEWFKRHDPNRLIPVFWPHDGLKRDPGSKQTIWKQYRGHDVNMFRFSAREDDETGGPQGVKTSCSRILERMKTGRFKVFSNCTDWFEEMRMYHMSDGKVVDQMEDIMSATRYVEMMLRKFRAYLPPTPRRPRYTQPIVSSRL